MKSKTMKLRYFTLWSQVLRKNVIEEVLSGTTGPEVLIKQQNVNVKIQFIGLHYVNGNVCISKSVFQYR